MVESSISLTDCLSYFDKKPDKPYFYVDTTGSLETFFTYKGTLLNLNNLHIRKTLKSISEDEYKEQIRLSIVKAAKYGEWLVFNLEKNTSFNLKEALKAANFDINELGDYSKSLTRDYYINNKYITKDEDKDNFGNAGFWGPNEKFRICCLVNCEEKEQSEVMKNNSSNDYSFLLVK